MDEYDNPSWLRPWRVTLVALAACAVVVAVLVLAFPAKSAEMPTVDNALILIADVSASMDADEKRIVRESHAYAIMSSEVVTAIQSGAVGRSAFAYIEFGGRAEIIIGWTTISGYADAEAFASIILEHAEHNPDLGPTTAMGNALSLAVGLMQEFPGVPLFRTVDVAGDGVSNYGDIVGNRQALLDMGATINGLPMLLRPDDANLADWYADNLIGGPRAFSLELRDIGDMPLLMRRKMVMDLF